MVSTEKRIARLVDPQTIYSATKAIQIFVFIQILFIPNPLVEEPALQQLNCWTLRAGRIETNRLKSNFYCEWSRYEQTSTALLDQRDIHKLSCQQCSLPQRAIAIISKIAYLVDHTMTGNQHCYGVMPNRGS